MGEGGAGREGGGERAGWVETLDIQHGHNKWCGNVS